MPKRCCASVTFEVTAFTFSEIVIYKYIRGLLEKYPTVFFYANT